MRALIVLVEKVEGVERSASFGLDGVSCLGLLARVARFLPPRVELHLFGDTDAKWCGRGLAPPISVREVVTKRGANASQIAKGAARRSRKAHHGA